MAGEEAGQVKRMITWRDWSGEEDDQVERMVRWRG